MSFYYFKLQGKIGDYAKPIRTKGSTSSKNFIAFQTAINQTIKQYVNKEANAENCRELWESLFSIYKNNPMNEIEKTWNVYKEVEEGLQKIGDRIAFDTVRTGYYPSKFDFWTTFKDFMSADAEDKENFIYLFHRFMITRICYCKNTAKSDTYKKYLDWLYGEPAYEVAIGFRRANYDDFLELVNRNKRDDKVYEEIPF